MSESKSLINLEDALGLKEPILKLIEVVEKAGIGLFKPWQIKREAKAHAEGIGEIACALRENIDLPIKFEDGKITLDTTASETLESRAFLRLSSQEIKRQKNIETIVAKSAEMLELEDNVSKELIDDDWATRFFNYAQDISDNQMQLLWSHILSGEVKRPNTYSIRTLEVMKNLNKTDADAFVEISKYLFDNNYIPNYGRGEFFNYSTIMELDEAGLINSSGMITKTIKGDYRFVYGNYLVKVKKADDKDISIQIFPLSSAGKEIIKLIAPNCDIEFLKSWSAMLKKQNHKISYAKITKSSEGSFSCELPMIEL